MRIKRICEIPGYKDIQPFYLVTDAGDIIGKSGKPLAKTYCRDRKYPYNSVTLFKTYGGYVHKQVHRIVALAFCDGRTEQRIEIDHINGDYKDDRAKNLRWVTRQENVDFRELRKYKRAKK